MLAPLASGVPSVMVPALMLLLKPPPFGWAGGCSSVVPCTVTVQASSPAPVAPHVAASLMPPTTTSARRPRSQVGDAGRRGNVVRSMTRKRSRVTLPPVLFTKRRRKSKRAERGVVRGIAREVAHAVRRGRCSHVRRRAGGRERCVALNRRREVLRPGRAEALAGACRRAVGVDEDEVGGVVVGVLRRADRARAERRDRAALAASVAVEGVVDGEGRQRGIAACPPCRVVLASLVEPTASSRLARL